VGTISGLDYWTGLLNWTTGLTQTAKCTSFSAEFIHSVTLLTLLPSVFPGVLEVKLGLFNECSTMSFIIGSSDVVMVICNRNQLQLIMFLK